MNVGHPADSDLWHKIYWHPLGILSILLNPPIKFFGKM